MTAMKVDEVTRALHEIARYVGISGDQMRRLLGVMEMCGKSISAVEPAPDGLVEQTLALVVGVRERIKRSPGLSSEPFSDKGWAVIEAAMRSALTSRAAGMEEAAKIVEENCEEMGFYERENMHSERALLKEKAAAIRAAKGE